MTFLLLRSPTEPPMRGSQLLGLVLYIFLLAISVWATGESLSINFNIGKLPAYTIGLAISLIATAMINIIKESTDSRSILPIIGGAFVFILMWGLSLMTNTHSFFMKSSLESIRKEELNLITKELELIGTKAEEILNTSRDKYETDVTGLVNSLRRQILDQNKPGLGPEAEKIITQLQELLGQPITPIEPDGSKSVFRSNQELANGYAEYIITDLLRPKLTAFDQEKTRVLNSLNSENNTELLAILKEMQRNNTNLLTPEAENILSRAYAEYQRQYDIISSKFSTPILGKVATYSLAKLPATPLSIELKKISSLPKFIRETGGYNQPNFIWAFLLAFGVDLGAFMIFSAMVLPKKREW